MANPFATTQKAPQAPQAPQAQAPQAPQAPQAAPQAPPVQEGVGSATVEKKARKKPNRQMTIDERKYVLDNYATKSTAELANELGLTRQQVYRTIHETRTKAKERLAELEKDPQNNAEFIQKAQALLAKLPEKPFGGGQGGGKRGSAIDNVLDELLG